MLDDRDRRLLTLLQEDCETNTAEIADKLSLSPSACSRRIARLKAEGYITGSTVLLDRRKINLPTTIFLLVRTGRHAIDWLDAFHKAVADIPEIVEVHRLTGNFDYILKLVLPSVEYYDTVYKQLLERTEMYDMSAHISMEVVKLSSGLPITHISRDAPRTRRIEDLTDDEVEMVRRARVSTKHDHLNALLDD